MRLQIMIQQQLAEALPLALEIIGRDPKYLTISPSLQMTAILAVGKLGSEQHVAAIEPLLEDRGEIQIGQQINGMGAAGGTIQTLQVRDVALAVLLHLTEQEPLTYGYLHAQANPQTVFNVQSSDAGKRRAPRGGGRAMAGLAGGTQARHAATR